MVISLWPFWTQRGAFDTVVRDILRRKLSHLGMGRRLFILIRKLYSDNSCQIRVSLRGNLSEPIPLNKGVKQGCILAPTLFNLFVNNLNKHLKEINAHSPKIGSSHIPLLLYAMILLSTSRVGLRHLRTCCIDYLKKNEPHLNFDKSKIVVFGKYRKLLNWSFEGKVTEQVREFKCLV